MRAIKTLQDAEIVIRDLHNQLDKFRSENIDMTKRRVINAHPSRDDYDYVVRKELQGVADTIQQVNETVVPIRYYTIVFSTSSYVYTGSSAPFIVKREGRPIQVSMVAEVPPSTEGLIVVPKYNGVSFLGGTGKFEMPTTTNTNIVLSTEDMLGVNFQVDSLVTIDVEKAGNAKKFTLEVVMEVI